MGFGGKGGGSQTSTQTAEPWGPQQPYLSDIFTNASNLYQNVSPQYFPGNTTAQPTWAQNYALQGITNTALTDPLRSIPAGTLANVASGNLIWANPAITPMADLAWNNPATNAPGQDALSSYLSGDRLAQGNPYLGAVSDSIAANVLPRIQSQFVNSGMLSSPEAARASSAGLTSAIAPYAFQQYQQEEQNQINAANALANRYLQGAGLQGQAATNYGGLFSNAYDTMLRAAGLAPTVQPSLYAPFDAMYAAGAAQQTQDQQAINDAVARWNFEQELPFNRLNQYIGQVTGNYGGTTMLTQPYFSNAGQNALSGAIGGATLGSSLLGPTGLGLASTAGGGAGIGAGLGALMMLFSDPRLKTDSEPVGKLDNGMTVYRYRYIDDPPEMRRIGLMADEVERKRPDAVAQLGPEWGALGGMRMVDYSRATEPA